MPTYEFRCLNCKKRFSTVMTISERENKRVRCPKCKSLRVAREISSFSVKTSKKS